jgi:Fuc2NAc and GlcNAc transferase
MFASLLILAAFVLSCGLTWAVRRLAAPLRLIDIPNERSSHARPVPRGGGVGIVLGFSIGAVALAVTGHLAPQALGIVAAGGIAVALVGLADDRWGLPAKARLLAHVAVACATCVALGPSPDLPLPGGSLALGWWAAPAVALYIVWAINYFNFMDGIDGIAGCQAAAVCLAGALISSSVLGAGALWLPLVLAAACLGFLVWNWPPASIFMGDVGSGFLGFAIGVMTIWFGYQHPALVWSWFILQGAFLVDATTTLVRRVRRGASATAAHRSHAYQQAAQAVGSHRKVTLAYTAIVVLWLAPIASAVAHGRLDGLWGLLVAYLPLVVAAFRWRAGLADDGRRPG